LEQVDERIDRMEAEIATVASNLFKDDHA